MPSKYSDMVRITLSFLLSSVLGYVNGLGEAVLINSCNRSLWYASVDNKPSPAVELFPGSAYREAYRVYPGAPLPGGLPPGGISIKVGDDPTWESDGNAILQFEYTYDPGKHLVWYDLSNINGDPFRDDGFMVQPTTQGCTTITCAPGEETCHDAFTYPTETGVVFACSSNASLVLTVCLANPGSGSTTLLSTMQTQFVESTQGFSTLDSSLHPSTNVGVCEATGSNDVTTVPRSTSTGTAVPSTPSQCSEESPCQGDMTFFQAGLGSCGLESNGSSEKVVALSALMMGPSSDSNAYCGKTITIVCSATKKTTTATVVDKCMGCDTYSIDLSEKAFLELDSLAVGRTAASWYFN